MSEPEDRDPTRSRTAGQPSDPPEANTDPGRQDPYESLYRGASQPVRGFRPTPRHFEPSLSPPGGVDGTFDWLYRPAAQPSAQPSAEASERPGSSDPSDPAAAAPPTVIRSARVEPPDAEPAPSAAPPTSGRGRAVLVGVLALLLVVLIVVFLGLRERGGPTATAGTVGPASPGSVRAVRPLSAAPDCQAPSATDDAGRAVSYTPAGLLDGLPSTAWRCDGDGVGHSIVFTFPSGSTVSQVGLVNGYAKVDPTSGAHRYPEYRRLTEVTWTFPDGASYPQALVDGEDGLQTMTVPAHPVGTVTLTLNASTAPGGAQRTRDAVLVSDVAFARTAS